MYINKPMVKFSGASQFFSCVCNFLLEILMVSDKMIHKAFRTHKTL